MSDFSSVLDKIMADLKSKLGREYQKNSEKGIAMINTIGAMVGAKVTDKKQSKNRLFLKFDNDLEEERYDCNLFMEEEDKESQRSH